MTKEEITAEVKRLIPCTRFLKRGKIRGMYICPFCGSGTKTNGTAGAKYYESSNLLSCFPCGADAGKGKNEAISYSVIDIYMQENGVDFDTARDTLAEELGLDTGRKETAAERKAREKKQREYKAKRERELAEAQAKAEEEAKKAANYDFTAYYKACRARLDDPEALAYLNGRGISKETAYNCFIGYDPEADPASVPGALGNEYRLHPCKRLIIPTSKRHYVGRRIDGQKDFDKVNPKGCSPGIFNKSRLAADVPAVFVCEGAFDALSVEEAGAAAVALNSASNTGALLTAIREKPTGAALVLCLDNDGAGEGATAYLQESLRELGAPFIVANICGTCKDPNEALQKDREAFITAVKQAQEQAKAYRKELETMTEETTAPQTQTAQELQEVERAQEVQEPQEKGEAAADQIPAKSAEELAAEYREKWKRGAEKRGSAFLQAITTEKYKPIPTGINSLDEALDGGFMKQWLVTLGAAPGAGKTALTQWIFENMASAGNTVFFINLEMSREQLIARSLARIIKEEYNTKIPPVQILKGYEWNDMQREKITAALKLYTEKTAPFICYNPEPKKDPGAEAEALSPAEIHQIIATVQETAKQAKAAGLNAPILVIDYLQVLEADGKDDKAEIIKEALKMLKKYAIEYNSIVFAITAQGREANKDGTSTLESGRDTSNIEYGADLVLGLDFTLCLPTEEEIIDKKTGKKVIDQATGKAKKQMVPGKRAAELTPQEKRKKTLVIHKARFSEAPQKIELLFDGESMSFTDVYGFNNVTKAEETEIETETFRV